MGSLLAGHRVLVALALALCLVVGCSENEPASTTVEAGGAAGAAPVAPSLRFDLGDGGSGPQTLELEPEEDVKLTVVATPPGDYRVRFSILEYENKNTERIPVDASLGETYANTDRDGRASVRLYAPSTQSVFELRASIGNLASASLEVRIREKSFGELEVTPDYSGHRPIDEWFTVAYPSERCENLRRPTSLTDASCTHADKPCATGPPGAALRIVDIWAGPSYAVTLGAGNHIWGCVDRVEILAKDLNFVTIPVSNVQISLAEEPLSAALGISEVTDTWVESLNGVIDTTMQAFTGDSANDLALVLDTMEGLIEDESDRTGFEERRGENGWEYLALASLSSQDNGLLLRNQLRGWMVAGADDLQTDDALVGRIDPVDSGFEFSMTEVAGIEAESAGFEPPAGEPTSWTAEPDDHLVLGTELRWAPSKLVTALAEARALGDYGEQSNLVGALGELLDCNVLAEALLNSNELGIYPGCDVECGVALCSTALETLVERTRNSVLDPVVLRVSASGVAVVDELARPASFSGTWLGSFPGGDPVVSGPIEGEATSATN